MVPSNTKFGFYLDLVPSNLLFACYYPKGSRNVSYAVFHPFQFKQTIGSLEYRTGVREGRDDFKTSVLPTMLSLHPIWCLFAEVGIALLLRNHSVVTSILVRNCPVICLACLKKNIYTE